MSLIIKVPCIMLAIVALHNSFTPPHQSSKSDRTPVSGVYAQIVQTTLNLMWLFKGVPCAVALADLVVTIAKTLPSDVSASILSAVSINQTIPDLRFTPLFLFGMTLISLGGLIRVSCYRTLKKFFTFEASIMKDHKLVTSGPYSIVRHPSYAGLLLVVVGLLCWFASPGSLLQESGLLDTMTGMVFFGGFGVWMLAVLVALMRRATVEDAALRETFRSEWEEWAKRVPYAFFPGVC